MVSGVQTDLTSQGDPLAVGDTIEIDAVGTSSTVLTLKLTRAGVTSTYQSVTDTTSPLTTGTWGVGGYGMASDGGPYTDHMTGGNL
jgi:hypothetical protein